MSDELIKGRNPSESVWRRAWNDSCVFLRTPFFFVAEIIFASASMVSAVVLTEQAPVTRIAVPIVALITPPVLTFLTTVCYAPFVQRDEARNEIMRLWDRLKPKLTVDEVEPEVNLTEHGQILPSEIVLLRIKNESLEPIERCTAQLIDVKPRVEWLDFVEDDRSSGQSIGFPTQIPLPMPLAWFAQESKKEDSSLRIPPDAEALLELCHYYQDRGNRIDRFTLSFQSQEMRSQYHLPVTEIVLSIRVDSDSCSPLYCIYTYCPEMPAAHCGEQRQIKYAGSGRPNIDEYRIFKQTPRPSHWGAIPKE